MTNKVLREGMGQATGLSPEAQLDTVITNALIIDYSGQANHVGDDVFIH